MTKVGNYAVAGAPAARPGGVVRRSRSADRHAMVAYKDVERVVDVVARAGLARSVVRLVPVGVVKG